MSPKAIPMLSVLAIFLFSLNFVSSEDCCDCHLRHFDMCSSHLIMLSQPVPMMTPGEIFDRMCAFLNESYNCRQEYLARCSTPSALMMIQLMTQKNDGAFHELCSTEVQYWRSIYANSHYCLQSTKMLVPRCMYDYQAGLEAALAHETTHVTGGCCAFNRLVSCTSEVVLTKCGAEALSVSRKIGEIFASEVANNLCKTYPADGAFCREVLPEVGTMPKGEYSAQYSQLFGQNHGMWNAGQPMMQSHPSKWTESMSNWNWNKKINK